MMLQGPIKDSEMPIIFAFEDVIFMEWGLKLLHGTLENEILNFTIDNNQTFIKHVEDATSSITHTD